jgi:hypothetical protein
VSQPAPAISLVRPDPGDAAFMPGLRAEEPLGRHWLAQVTLRLRREVCWLWREHTLRTGVDARQAGGLPPPADPTLTALDLRRYDAEKRSFFTEDVTARHLSERIGALPPTAEAARGSFGWVAEKLELAPVERFVLALALLPYIDGTAGAVIATCLGDPLRTSPTLALAQRLWDDPEEILLCFDPAHRLLSHGLIGAQAGALDWQAGLFVPALVARSLLFPSALPSAALQRPEPVPIPAALGAAATARIATALAASQRSVVPLIGAMAAPLAGIAGALVAGAGGTLVQPHPSLPRDQLAPMFTSAWLQGHAIYLAAADLAVPGVPDHGLAPLPLPALPLTIIIGARDRSALRGLAETAPAIEVPASDYAERLAFWQAAIPDPELAPILPEVARRFRYEQPAIARVGREIRRLGRPATTADLFAVARADLDLGTLAQPVTPRFRRKELMLPAAQSRQIDEITRAMENLTRVHHAWGTGKVWHEAGLTALFAGPPGTGKTMAAEAIAEKLALPLYRIDLSQVVNKYIGETEKNLRLLFDAADSADAILLFDEADALFGKRTEVKDAHDRYANLEISYLLERMERFRGLAILATNRRRDLDEAFLRRLRFVVEFPLPGIDERLRIWRAAIPAGVDATALDFDFLAQRFPLAGGYIRAIVFQACLQSAGDGAPQALDMPAIVRAVHREFEKLERASSLDQFGPYAGLVAAEGKAR